MQTSEQPAATRGSDRLLWGIVAAAIALMAAGFALLLVVQNRQPAEYPEDTPQGVVQRYLQAQADGRFSDAERYLSESVKNRDPNRPKERPSVVPQNSYRVVLQDARVDGDQARVTVAVTVFHAGEGGGLFGSGSYEYTNTHVFELRREGGEWRIVSPEYFILW